MKRIHWAVSAFSAFTLCLSGGLNSADAGSGTPIHFSFEQDLQNWKVVEGHFGDIRCGMEFQHHSNNTKPWIKDGKFHLSSLEIQNAPIDEQRGVIESPIWKNTGEKVTLTVGGGSVENVAVELCEILSDECTQTAPAVRVIAAAKGKNHQDLHPVT
ncbi:MAG: hypothetical protein J6A23_09595, partial [Thermoguttaceae bacterium]|nr:hypothetical protein [Thermoguttaceae bacterium]